MTTPTFPSSELGTLLRHRARWCVSIFLPTHRLGAEIRQDPIRLRNLLDGAEAELRSRGASPPEIERLLQPARDRVSDREFWRHQSDGLALFLAPGFFQERRVPIDLEERFAVGEEFEILPLVPLLVGDGRFYVLALSQASHRLFEATRHSISQVPTPGVPPNLDAALRLDEPERQLQFHTGTATAARGRRAAAFHGHGVGADDADSKLQRYCQLVDRGLGPLLAETGAPLVLAAVEYEQAIYREANSYPHLLDAGIAGNHDATDPSELLLRARQIVEPHFEAEVDSALHRFADLSATERASLRAPEIVVAAAHGRVETLFVDPSARLPGTLDERRGVVTLHADEQGGQDRADAGRDLLELAARETLAHAGAVFTLTRERMPEHATAAAIFRY